ncbi:MAG: hypothetical protein WD426_19470 [Anditalea sp.]
MKNLKILLLFSILVLGFSCNEEPEEQPLVEKNARIEVDFEGSLDQYLINFGIHSLFKGQNGLVSAVIRQPDTMEWTQVIDPANTFNLSTPLTFSQLVVESEEPVHTFGFIFDAVYTGGIPDEDFQGLSATIMIFGDNEEVESYQYEAKPVGEASEPLSEVVRF